ncbi:DegQ family serine endoprotease [Pannonibacter sp. SL95]|uniref:DegQ family serine endoprotease n=1 Tax=Pannonibacter sp. SL95 TaxID=2995153 RepID=UPI002273B660|nr:DegQ family serine endoprotease [Pannonibacter sp. SL95]MCY1705916.1 DegQ family serine endoprotease [Pannonibacter sp. SL95]
MGLSAPLATGLKHLARLAAACGTLALLATVPVPTAQVQERVVPASEAQITLSFAPIVKTVAPAVVNVYASRMVQQPVSPFLDDPFFRRFFGDQVPGANRPRQRMESSLGSGVIISADGVIITNNHVIKDADEVRVALADRREFDADIILKDERTDLAVLRIRDGGADFPNVDFADSDSLAVGDIVLAIGNPFGVGQTVTQGIVSALARTRVGITDYQFFIQTDAAINPGNSGGALVDMQGRLVGINTAIFSRGGGSNGIGFAIPANMVKFVANSAVNAGKIERPWLGATVQVVSAEIAEALGLDRPRGVLVTRVFAGSPADAAGLKVGDLITAVDGIEVLDPDSFGYRFATKAVGGETRFSLRRAGKDNEVSVALKVAPETTPRDARLIRNYSPFEGATVMNLSPAVAEELGLEVLEEGVVIAEVAQGSPAAQVGLQVGDIILVINDEQIATTAMLDRATSRKPRLWRLEVKRGGEVSRIVLRG